MCGILFLLIHWRYHSLALTHWSRVTHICVGKLTSIGSDNGLSLEQRQAIIWTNAGILLIGSLGTNFSEILIEILKVSFKKMHLKVSSAKWRPFCLGLNVLNHWNLICMIYMFDVYDKFSCPFLIHWRYCSLALILDLWYVWYWMFSARLWYLHC